MYVRPQNAPENELTEHIQCVNASEHVLTKPIPCQGGHKMYLNMRLPNPSYANEDRKCISTCVDQTNENLKCISTCVDQSPPMTAMRENASQHVFTKTLSCQQG